MMNEVVIVGKLKEIGMIEENKQRIQLDVERAFDEKKGRIYDTFVCQLWYSIFSKIISICSIGDLIAIKGRLINEEMSVIVVAEKVVLLNKSNKNILKNKEI